MLATVSLQQRRAAHALSQQSWWPALRELMETELGVVNAAMRDAMNIVVLHQLQGRAKAICELRDLVLTAGEVIAQAERHAERLPSGLGTPR